MKGIGNQQDYGMRIYDPRLGKLLTTDPLSRSYPMLTPYQFASNSPISGVDLDGLEYYYAADGSFIGKGADESNIEVRLGKITGQTKSGNNIVNATDINGSVRKDWLIIHSNHDEFIAFASLVHTESSGSKEESFAIANVTMNFLKEGGSSKLKTLEDVALYDNTFAQGATQTNLTEFAGAGFDRNSKYAISAVMNALGHFNNPTAEEYKDVSDDADSWDGIDLISSKHSNNHRTYKWNSDSKELLKTYKKKVNGGVDVTKWTFKAEKYQISATKIIGKTLFTNLEGGRGEKKQSEEKFKVNFNK